MHLDRRVAFSSGSYSSSTGRTTWTLPYSVPTDGSEGELVVCRQDDSTVISTGRAGATSVYASGDFRSTPVYAGILYDFRYVPSRLFYRDRNGVPEQSGRTQLRYVDVRVAETDALMVLLKRTGRDDYTETLREGTDFVHVPVLAQNTQSTLEITDRSPGKVRLVGIDWEGFITLRDRRL